MCQVSTSVIAVAVHAGLRSGDRTGRERQFGACYCALTRVLHNADDAAEKSIGRGADKKIAIKSTDILQNISASS